MGWAELGNGELLRAGEGAGFQVMVTGDENLSYQQNLDRQLAPVVLDTTRWSILKRSPEKLSDIAAAVDRAEPGSFEALSMTPSLRRPPRRFDPQS